MTMTASQSLNAAGQALGYTGGLTISMQVTDLERSIAFYQDVVGFTLQYKVDEIGWCELETSVPQVNVGLSQVETPKVAGSVPTFGVGDIDAARKTLESRGARFDGDTIEIPDMVKLATFFDPDDNALMLFQDLSGMTS